MNIVETKYGCFPYSGEFPDLYHVLLYESGGDFETYSKVLGYEDYDDFIKDYEKLLKEQLR